MAQDKIADPVDVSLNTGRYEATVLALLGILLGLLALFRAGAWFEKTIDP